MITWVWRLRQRLLHVKIWACQFEFWKVVVQTTSFKFGLFRDWTVGVYENLPSKLAIVFSSWSLIWTWSKYGWVSANLGNAKLCLTNSSSSTSSYYFSSKLQCVFWIACRPTTSSYNICRKAMRYMPSSVRVTQRGCVNHLKPPLSTQLN